ncbi:MAG: hypothetical protein L0H84_05440 [Pseudonocardia sp.]|nr:hypothetical protein [Pseudonocardia sp.]
MTDSALIEALVAHGITTVFVAPGVEVAGVRAVALPDERSAAFAAAAAAQVSGRPGVVLTGGGAGAVAATGPAVAAASAAHLPLLVVSTTAVDAGPADLAGAFAALRGPMPQPVHVAVGPSGVHSGGDRPLPDAAEIDKAVAEDVAARLTAAELPLVVLGAGAVEAGLAAAALAEELGAPIVTTAALKGVIDEGHPLAVGAAAELAALRPALTAADAVFVVGDVDLPEPLVRSSTVGADPAAAVAAVLAALPLRHARMGVSRAAELRALCRAAWRRDGGRLEELIDALREQLPDETVIVGDASPVTTIGTVPFLQIAGPRRFSAPAVPVRGWALAAAIGVSAARPGTPVASVVSAAELLAGAADLAAAGARRRPLPIVAVDTSEAATVDHAMLAMACDAHGVRAISPGEVAVAVADAWDTDRPTVVHLDWVLDQVHGAVE